MAQFDVHRASRSAAPPYFVILHSELLRLADTVVVAPLHAVGQRVFPRIPRLFPPVTFNDEKLVLVVPQIGAVRKTFLGPVIGSLADRRDDIIAALDMLFTGV
jgi:toxin CcdB